MTVSKIYAVDFDGTLCEKRYPSIGNPISTVINFVKEAKQKGDKIILWTSRIDDELEDALKWCAEQGLEFDAVNENLKETIEKWGTDPRKLTADYFIDDKQINLDGIKNGSELVRAAEGGENIETREMYFKTDFKTRSEEGKEKIISGYFIRFNEETELYKGVFEEISPGAIVNSLKANDVRCLFNHNSEIVLGRTGNSTLQLRADDIGLWGEVTINPNDKQANDIYARVERGDIDACSFGFIPLKEEIENRSDGSVKFIVKDIDLKEISAVTFPAYPQTSISARKEDCKQNEQRLLDIKKQKLKERLTR